jgi:hypothetical protein
VAVLPSLRKNPNRAYEELKDKAQKARKPFDKDVLLNLAFYLDKHYVEWQAESNSLQTIARGTREKRTPRPVSNKIMHFVVKQHAATLKDRPQPDVLPASEDPLDLSMASVAKAYLNWLSDPEVADFDGELSDAALWALAGGEGILKWTYSGTLKRPDVTAVSPLELYRDPYAKRWRNVRYVIHEQFMDIQAIYDAYDVKVQPTQVSKADAEKAAILRDMGMAPVLEGAVVNELWLKPGQIKQYPRGLFVVWSGKDILVEPQDFPYKHGHLPFTPIGAIKRPGSTYTTCTVKYLRSPQMELNKYHAQRITVRQYFANPKWWIPEELELEEPPDDSPNQILKGNSGGGQYKPELIQPTIFPENSDGDWIVNEMRDVAGQHEISEGGVPGRVEAAQAIELLQNTDDTHLSELRRSIRSAIAEGGWQSLMLLKQYHPDEVVLQAYSREGLPEVKRFLATDLKEGIRVRCTMGTGLSDNRAARQKQALELWQNQVIQDPEVMADLMDLPTASLTPNRMYDVKLARNENLTMAEEPGVDGSQGTAITPNSWDAHDIHLREHNNYRKSQEYIQAHAEVKKKFEFHCQMHEQLWLEELQKQALRMQIAQGAQPGSAAQQPEATASDQPASEAPEAGAEEPQPNGQ